MVGAEDLRLRRQRGLRRRREVQVGSHGGEAGLDLGFWGGEKKLRWIGLPFGNVGGGGGGEYDCFGEGGVVVKGAERGGGI